MTEDGNRGFPFSHMNGRPTGSGAAVRPAAQYQTGTSWNGVSFRLPQGPLLWLKSRRTRDTWKKQQLIRQETYTPIPKQAHAEEKLTCLHMLFFPTLGKKRVISTNIHHTTVQPLIKMGTALAKFLSNNGVRVCVCSSELDFLMPAAADTTKTLHCLHCLTPKKFPNSPVAWLAAHPIAWFLL